MSFDINLFGLNKGRLSLRILSVDGSRLRRKRILALDYFGRHLAPLNAKCLHLCMLCHKSGLRVTWTTK